ncbi:MOSC domain-containing protein [Ancylobacter sp. A5.8]|uniref:MOSC domain-containing protein n=1 Tax=Ancylobacter gelatini TaxID=2919920 RepID=UPI001F4E470F|nr:MOSC domain-containing protein [Ancylobacter gelatini]MCJ8142464.1 MOSC domain-containing protein [Ancylobacter gelatini]
MAEMDDLFGVAAEPASRFKARLARTLLGDGAGFITREVPVLGVTLEGVPGDRHAGHARPADSRVPWYPRGTSIRNCRQVSLVAPDELARIAERLGLAEIRPEWLGANLVVEGVAEFTRLPPGTRLHFPGGAALAVEGENAPCRHAGAAVAAGAPDAGERAGLDLAFIQAAKGLRGLVAWVERAGDLAAGDEITVRVPEQRLWRRAR